MARDEFHDQPIGAERRRNVHRRCQREEEKQVWRIRLEVSPGLRTGKISGLRCWCCQLRSLSKTKGFASTPSVAIIGHRVPRIDQGILGPFSQRFRSISHRSTTARWKWWNFWQRLVLRWNAPLADASNVEGREPGMREWPVLRLE